MTTSIENQTAQLHLSTKELTWAHDGTRPVSLKANTGRPDMPGIQELDMGFQTQVLGVST